jgi:hypothetical protein
MDGSRVLIQITAITSVNLYQVSVEGFGEIDSKISDSAKEEIF